MKECFPGAQKSTDSQELTRLGDQVMTDSGPKGWLSALTAGVRKPYKQLYVI